MEQTLPDQQTTCESVPDTGRAGRFSTGLEALPPTPAKLHRGKYSEGVERFPASPDNRHPGRFSDGVERLPETPAKVRRGELRRRAALSGSTAGRGAGSSSPTLDRVASPAPAARTDRGHARHGRPGAGR